MMKHTIRNGAFYLCTEDGQTFYLGKGQATVEQPSVTTVAEIPYKIDMLNYPMSITLAVHLDTDDLLKRMLGMTPYQWRKKHLTKEQFKHWKRCYNRKRTKK